ncbi:membrane protein [Marinicella pacifica]|uniref:Membrane protein n=1 Tax=Marinicella pacifica TaxID=1171543 RepID=A0A917CKN6_9GAMM|nr:DUF3307 domain-containing protein [Marinicella pacifica]GGF89677.1 membrane protein [Marinicella pacifica]
MIILIKLIFAHLLGDFLLQPRTWVREKEHHKLLSWRLYMHVLVHGILVLLVMGSLQYWLLALVIMALHFLIDMLKLYAQNESSRTRWFIIDQSLHIIGIVVLWFIWFKPTINFAAWFNSQSLWLYATALLFLTFVAGVVVQILMSRWTEALNDLQDGSLAHAGRYIGMLERLFVFVFIVVGQWQAIGFLLGAKSVFRFGDLRESKNRQLTEYVLIGTLLSFAIAVATAMLVVYLS